MTDAQANYILFQTVGREQMFTTLTIISLVPARVLANQRYRYEHSERDEKSLHVSYWCKVHIQFVNLFDYSSTRALFYVLHYL